MEETEAELIVGEPPKIPTEPPQLPRKSVLEMSADELVAKSIVPVKKEYICPVPIRLGSDNNGPSGDAVPASTTASARPVSKEKKSKRQLKRERNQVFICVYAYHLDLKMSFLRDTVLNPHLLIHVIQLAGKTINT